MIAFGKNKNCTSLQNFDINKIYIELHRWLRMRSTMHWLSKWISIDFKYSKMKKKMEEDGYMAKNTMSISVQELMMSRRQATLAMQLSN